MLTPRQHEAWIFLAAYTREHGYAPSFEEIGAALNLASKSGVSRLVCGLEERGFIRRLPHRARAIEILRMPETPKEKK